MNAIVIDDIDDVRENTVAMLHEFSSDITIVAQANSVKTALEQIQKHQPQIIFLDIELGDGTGFDVLKQIEVAKYKIVFVTVYDHFAIRAFKYSAVDYLLKPFSYEELSFTIDKLKQAISKEDIEIKYNSIVSNFENKNNVPTHITLRTHLKTWYIAIDDILYCKADVNYTHFFLKDGTKILTSHSLKEYETMLAEAGFYRIHQSYLLNIKHVKRVTNVTEPLVELLSNDVLPISSRKKNAFEAFLKNNNVLFQ